MQNEFGSKGIDSALDRLSLRASKFFGLFDQLEGRRAFRERPVFLKHNADDYEALVDALMALGAQMKLVREKTDLVIPLERRAEELTDALRLIIEAEDPTYVYWLERRGRGVFLQATPIDVAEILAEKLFAEVPSVVLTSATLAVDGTFDFVKSRLGLDGPRELIVPGHFDYAQQALLYIPDDLPDPRSDLFVARASDEILALLSYSRGRAFVLFTSYQQMRRLYEAVEPRLDHPALMQGTAPNSALLDEFKSTPNAVLFATASFWQGVDVPGEQLSCVIVDKLPFAVPSDPIVEARIRAIRQAGGRPFDEFQVPAAVLSLKQGFGRLIRSAQDRGVLSLLDNRVLKQRYGKVFLESLPDYAFSSDIADVARFFETPAES